MTGGVRSAVAAAIGAALVVALLAGAASLLRSGRSIEHQLDKRTGNATFSCTRFGVLRGPHAATNTADLPSALARGTLVYDCAIDGVPGTGECTGLRPSGEPAVVRARLESGRVVEGQPCERYVRL
jgi:hypothetical protein